MLILALLALAAWRLRPPRPGEPVASCPARAVARLDGRPIALCLHRRAEALGLLLTRAGASRCGEASAAVNAGDFVEVDAACAATPLPMPAATRLALGLKIDLNRASQQELEALPRIGPAIARRIVADRSRRGPFLTVDALDRVRGIGPGLLRRLEGLISAGGAAGGGR